MKKKLALLASPLVLLLSGTAVANMNFMDCWCPSFYAGADAQARYMPFQKDFGGNILNKNYPQGNFFAGFKLNNCIGIEAGYEVSKKKVGNKIHAPTDLVFGTTVEPVDPPAIVGIRDISHTTSRINGWNLNLVGFLPVCCEEYNLSLIGSVGLTHLKMKVSNRRTNTITASVFDPITGQPSSFEDILDLTNRKYNKTKTVLRLSGGIQHMLCECFGVRVMVNWENTAKLSTRGRDIESNLLQKSIVRAKNSFNYGLGVFTTF